MLPSPNSDQYSLSYKIENASRDDSTKFRCMANNGYGGDIIEEVVLVVKCKYSKMQKGTTKKQVSQLENICTCIRESWSLIRLNVKGMFL